MHTTLNKIREYSPCARGWEKLLKSLGKTKADDEPLALVRILESNGIRDAIWCLRAVDGYDREIRLFAVECARRVEHLHPICKPTLDIAERFVNGQATEEDLAAARAASAAARAASAAASAAACAAASAAARTAARTAASAAAWDAAAASAWAAEEEYQAKLFIKFFGE